MPWWCISYLNHFLFLVQSPSISEAPNCLLCVHTQVWAARTESTLSSSLPLVLSWPLGGPCSLGSTALAARRSPSVDDLSHFCLLCPQICLIWPPVVQTPLHVQWQKNLRQLSPTSYRGLEGTRAFRFHSHSFLPLGISVLYQDSLKQGR